MTKPEKKQWFNDSFNYGVFARSLHWIIAALFLAAYVSVYFRRWFTEADTPINLTALQLHLSFGVTIMVFVILRVIYKLSDKAPQDPPGPAWEHRLAHIAHYTLYAVMIIMPITGYLGTGLATQFFWMFEIPQFQDTWLFELIVQNMLGMNFEQFEAPIDFIHKNGGAYIVWVLIAGHVAAALYHHFVRKDGVLVRMTTGAV